MKEILKDNWALRKLVSCYTAAELAKLDKVHRNTVARSKKYIPVKFINYRSSKNKKGYSLRYIRKSDLKDFF